MWRRSISITNPKWIMRGEHECTRSSAMLPPKKPVSSSFSPHTLVSVAFWDLKALWNKQTKPNQIPNPKGWGKRGRVPVAPLLCECICRFQSGTGGQLASDRICLRWRLPSSLIRNPRYASYYMHILNRLVVFVHTQTQSCVCVAEELENWYVMELNVYSWQGLNP